MTYTPTVRKPTGVPAAPLIMVSGFPKYGKSTVAYKLGLSERINKLRVADLGEGSADEYGGLDCYEIVEWGKSWADLQDTVAWAIAQPCPDGMMNAFVIDSGTAMWDSLKIRADKRARSSKKNVEALKRDPNLEIDVSMPYWNDAKETWQRVMGPMKLAPNLVGVVLVQTELVTEVVNGVPTKNKVISYQCEKTLPAAVTAHVQVREDHSAWLIEVRSLTVNIPKGGLRLNDDNPLGHLLELLSPDGVFQAPSVVTPFDDEREPSTANGDDAPVVAQSDAQEAAVRVSKLSGADKALVTKLAKEAGINNIMRAGDRADQLLDIIDNLHAGQPASEPEKEEEH